MKKVKSLILTAGLLIGTSMFTACDNSGYDNRDSNVPDNIEDNVAGTARNTTSENEEEARILNNRTTTGDMQYPNGMYHGTLDNNMNNSNMSTSNVSNHDLLMRIQKLEKEIQTLKKNEKVGQK